MTALNARRRLQKAEPQSAVAEVPFNRSARAPRLQRRQLAADPLPDRVLVHQFMKAQQGRRNRGVPRQISQPEPERGPKSVERGEFLPGQRRPQGVAEGSAQPKTGQSQVNAAVRDRGPPGDHGVADGIGRGGKVHQPLPVNRTVGILAAFIGGGEQPRHQFCV